ncbi:glycosyltransferase family 4 protein [Aneurinibacillus thermoaerophilus]|uniref:glycosyltransferase family 4 protein n=2 Tax=Aneurinibacillus group TaxID=85151 RepID=UPI0009E6C68F|nr:glycosyltransferase family 4 protein [Aneurinibacillus thermoaerophilus]
MRRKEENTKKRADDKPGCLAGKKPLPKRLLSIGAYCKKKVKKQELYMKILQVNKFYPPVIGGVEKVVYDLVEGMCSLAEMEVLVANTEWKYVQEIEHKAKIHRVPSIGTYFSMPVAPTFPLWLKKIKTDIIHFHFPFPLGELSYLLVDKIANIPAKTVVTWHSDIVRQKRFLKLYHPFLKRFLEKVDTIIATSPNMVEASPYLKEHKDKCRVIPLGIDVKEWEKTDKLFENVKKVREEVAIKPIILFVGRLVYYKGVEYLIEAMTEINASLFLVGEGPLKPLLQKRAEELGITEKINFLGGASKEQLVTYLHACDIFVLPSVERSEAFGIVQLEAMACGKPIVSTNLTTGVPFVNQDGKTGIVVPPKDIKSLTQALTFLIENESVRKQYGERGKERVYEHFTREKMVQSVYTLYQELLEGGTT